LSLILIFLSLKCQTLKHQKIKLKAVKQNIYQKRAFCFFIGLLLTNVAWIIPLVIPNEDLWMMFMVVSVVVNAILLLICLTFLILSMIKKEKKQYHFWIPAIGLIAIGVFALI